MTRSSPYWASSMTSAATAASPRGPTSSRCSRRERRSAAAPGRGARSRSSPRAGPRSPTRTSTPHQDAETGELFAALRDAIESDLSPHQREVLVAATLNEVPIDVLAERLNATRGALYKTIHDARGKLRAALAARELGVGDHTATATTRPHDAPRRTSQASVA